MAAVIDTIILGLEELILILKDYPHAIATPVHPCRGTVRRFRVVITGIDDDGWYTFLVANRIEKSSRNFNSRLKSDVNFANSLKLSLSRTPLR